MSLQSSQMPAGPLVWALVGLGALGQVQAQSVLFDFDNAPLQSSLPLDLTVGGITAHLSATGQGFSIQDSSAPVVPVGFSGRFVYPNSVYSADLIVDFSKTLSAFSILYSPQELGCDDSATMRVTATMNGSFVGTQTATSNHPGTWPLGTLGCSFAQGFNGVVVHYDKKPPTCQDYGVIFLADNMSVTPIPVPAWTDLGSGLPGLSGIPSLVGTGTLSAGSPGSLTLSKAKPSSPCMLIFSSTSTPVPFLGGVLVPYPADVTSVAFTQANGALPLSFTWPSNIASGTSMWVQYAIYDPAAIQSASLSNALKLTTP